MIPAAMEKVLEDVREVAGKDESFLGLVAAGEIPKPPLSSFNKWISWRKSSGTRPTKGTGEERRTESKEEAMLAVFFSFFFFG